jgi:hypothetical protein
MDMVNRERERERERPTSFWSRIIDTSFASLWGDYVRARGQKYHLVPYVRVKVSVMVRLRSHPLGYD